MKKYRIHYPDGSTIIYDHGDYPAMLPEFAEVEEFEVPAPSVPVAWRYETAKGWAFVSDITGVPEHWEAQPLYSAPSAPDSALVERLLSGRHPLATEAAGEIMRLEAENARLRKYTILNEPSAPDSAVETVGEWTTRMQGWPPSAPDSAVREAIKDALDELKKGIEKIKPIYTAALGVSQLPIELHKAAQKLSHLLEEK